MHNKSNIDNNVNGRYLSNEDKCDYVQPEETIKVNESDLVVLQLNIRGLSSKLSEFKQLLNKEAIWLYAELFLGHHDGSCHGLW